MNRRIVVLGVAFLLTLGGLMSWRLVSGIRAHSKWQCTPQQEAFLPAILKDTQRILITRESDSEEGATFVAEINDSNEIAKFVESTRITHLEGFCACMGDINIEFIGNGKTNELNYKSESSDTYLKVGLFVNQDARRTWGDEKVVYVKEIDQWVLTYQGKPSKQFRELVAKYANH